MSEQRPSRRSAPLDAAALDRLALRYVERYATSRAKLADYLSRKLRERGWAGEGAPPVEPIVARCADAGYVDDLGFADARARSLVRRGYGAGRVGLAMRAAGIDPEVAAAVVPPEADLHAAAETFARRKRIGPFAAERADPRQRQRQLAAMIRAGHGYAVARRFVDAAPDEVPILDG